MVNTFQDKLVLVIVSELESKNILFVEDGNHGEYRPLSHEFVEEGIPFVRPPDLVNGRINLKECQKINTTAFKRVRKGIGQGGDIVLTHNATIGRVAITNETDSTFVTNPQTTVWRSNNNKIINNKYLYYFMCSAGFQEQLDFHKGRNATFDYVSLTKQRSLVIPILEIEIQKKIAHILSTLDDKIELNRKMNQTLESMASVIFKSWFVDFDPVHAKANCTDEAEIENIAKKLGISKAILDLFPSEFEESELGMIPKGWEATELSQVCKIQSGYAFKSAWWQDTGVKVIKIKNIDGNRVNTLDCECVSEEIATKNSNFKLSSGDFLIAMTGATVGKVGVIYTLDEEYLLNQRVGRFQPIKYYDEYVKIFASSSKFFESIQGQAQGSAQPNISAREIETVKIIKPNNEIMKAFSSLLNPFFSKILEHQGEIQTLEKTRDTLLPKLLSGEIDVSELKI
ncbi:restriction endonuclease subunit S [Aliarcobacter sp. ERUVET-7]|uniref:restriction endonuclease subunit S n=1 Tax=Aliarcobacter sp. ERUVET-7 TaxID=3429683 RepID=UPI003D6AC8F6